MIGCSAVGVFSHLESDRMCQMDLVASLQDHDMSDMDHVDGEETLHEQWQRYVAARKKALAARSLQPGAAQDRWLDHDAPSADAPIARVLHLVPRPRSGQ
jgi:hypothetical protein